MFSIYILTSVDQVTITLTLPRRVGLGLGLGTQSSVRVVAYAPGPLSLGDALMVPMSSDND